MGDFIVEDPVSTASDRPDPEDRSQKRWSFWSDLRDVEGQSHTPWQRTIMLSTDRDVEASLTVNESRDPMTKVTWDSIQPVRGTGPFLLIVRTGRIVTDHRHRSYE